MIDNYDSFTYNLVQYLGVLGSEVEVHRNDKITLDEIDSMKPERIVISPGPGTPQSAGITISMIERFHPKVPILGVCLGHQAIGAAFGGRVLHAGRIMHGKTSEISHDGKGVFRDLPDPITATRYHSLAVERKSLPSCLEKCPLRLRTVKSWGCAIASIQWKESSFTQNQFSPKKG
jgi:anthranilate synthase component 2